MPPNLGRLRAARLCTGLTVAGGVLLAAGKLTGLAGEASRLTGGRGWHPAAAAAEILIIAGMLCGAALLGVAAVWHASVQWARTPDRRRAPAQGLVPAREPRIAQRFAPIPREPIAPLPRPAWQAGMTGPQPRVGMTGPQPRVGMTGPQPRVEMTGPQPRVGMTGPQPRVGGFQDSDPITHLDPADSATAFRAPELAHQIGPRALGSLADAPVRQKIAQLKRELELGTFAPPAEQKIAELKDLYREAEGMGEAELTAHWEDLRRRQHELIRQYFERAGLGEADNGGADNGHTAG